MSASLRGAQRRGNPGSPGYGVLHFVRNDGVGAMTKSGLAVTEPHPVIASPDFVIANEVKQSIPRTSWIATSLRSSQ